MSSAKRYINKMLATCKSIALPRYLANTPYSTFETFETTTDWTVGAGSAATNTTEFRTGTQSVKLTTPSGVVGFMSKTTNFISNGRIRLSFYLHDALADYDYFSLYLSTDSGYTKAFYYACVIHSYDFKLGWNTYEIYPEMWTVSGGAVWTDPIIRVRLRMTPKSGKVVNMSFDLGETSAVGIPLVMINFDDASVSIDTYAFPYLSRINARASFYIRTGWVDTNPAYITSKQLQKMYANGWSICNHTRNHSDLDTLSQADAQTEMLNGKTDLDSWYLNNTSSYLAYPGGLSNETVRAAAIAEGMLTGRCTNVNKLMPYLLTDETYIFGVQDISYTTSLATAKTYVDKAYNNNHITSLLFHSLVTGAPAAYQWPVSDFQALMDYIYAYHMPFITIDDYYKAQSGIIRVPKG